MYRECKIENLLQNSANESINNFKEFKKTLQN